jgi:hypothetical protein
VKWFKHDSDAHGSKNIVKLIKKYGLAGYGLYWACLELIANEIDKKNTTFELDHDSESLSDMFNETQARIEEIMLYCKNIGLFDENEVTGKLRCLKLADRMEDNQAKNLNIQAIINEIKQQKEANFQKNSETFNADKTITDKTTHNDNDMAPAAHSAPITVTVPVTVKETVKVIPIHTQFVMSFAALYEQKSGHRYNLQPSDFRLSAKLIKDNGIAVVVEKTRMLADACENQSPWYAKDGWAAFTIRSLQSHFNRLIPPKEPDKWAAVMKEIYK